MQRGGGAKAPQQSKQQRKNELLQERLMTAQLKQSSQPIEFPEIAQPAPALPPPPAPSQTSADVTEAEQQARRTALRRNSPGRKTIFAGETGGYRPSALGGQKTILG
jgi:hypothetical protein